MWTLLLSEQPTRALSKRHSGAATRSRAASCWLVGGCNVSPSRRKSVDARHRSGLLLCAADAATRMYPQTLVCSKQMLLVNPHDKKRAVTETTADSTFNRPGPTTTTVEAVVGCARQIV